jgi:hypothetical protein
MQYKFKVYSAMESLGQYPHQQHEFYFYPLGAAVSPPFSPPLFNWNLLGY